MQILKRARGHSDGDITSFKDVPDKDEINRRTCKAGYTTKYGEPTYSMKIQTTVLCGKTKLNVWPRDENGQLIGD